MEGLGVERLRVPILVECARKVMRKLANVREPLPRRAYSEEQLICFSTQVDEIYSKYGTQAPQKSCCYRRSQWEQIEGYAMFEISFT